MESQDIYQTMYNSPPAKTEARNVAPPVFSEPRCLISATPDNQHWHSLAAQITSRDPTGLSFIQSGTGWHVKVTILPSYPVAWQSNHESEDCAVGVAWRED